ncbi:unnamed protein product [Microthlaspi erraticum]|uniref:F-box domain-containing protein n=1 Tax=Microthlaspi erraticum TaxID=1685480 RepID=A0A6D2HRP1_9BRAS|nr:unnamed protein product [Microthlaspi erraticum]
MKRLKKNDSEFQIPADLLIDISLRCPSKSIARFRCVSKFWFSVLGRPEFTESFLTKSLTRPRLLFAFEVDGRLFFSSSLQVPNPKDKTSSLVVVDHQTSFPTGGSSNEFHHLNGLVYRQEQRKTQSVLVICHPSTGTSLTLLDAKTEKLVKRNYLIGYDPMEQRFKLLSITCPLVNIYNVPQEHRVVTLGNGEHLGTANLIILWREIYASTVFCITLLI